MNEYLEYKMGRVKIITFSDAKIKDYAGLSEQINALYAKKHGYGFEAYHNRGLSDDWDVHWEKVKLLRDNLKNKKNGYVVWIDADAAFHHHDVPLEAFMSGKDMVVSHDGVNKKDELEESVRDQPWYVNTGVLMVKNTPWSRKVIDEWIGEAGEFKKGSPLQDQDKFVSMLKSNWDKYKNHITVLAPKTINSEFGDDTQNTFVWHLMKREHAYRAKRFQELLDRVLPDGPKATLQPIRSDLEKVREGYHSRYRTHPRQAAPVLIVMYYDDGVKDYSAIAEKVNRMYAAEQGYDLMAVRSRLSARDPRWDKVRVMDVVMNDIEEAKGHEWYFWIDSDAVFAQHGVNLKSILDEGGELVISEDSPNKGSKPPPGEIYTNTGTFGLKNSDWAREFVKHWWATPMGMETKCFHEQTVLNHMYKTNAMGLKKKILVHPYDRINSAFRELPVHLGISSGKLDKTFVVHMMRKPSHSRRVVFDKIDSMIAKGQTRRPQHVVDPPDSYYEQKRSRSSTSSWWRSRRSGRFLSTTIIMSTEGGGGLNEAFDIEPQLYISPWVSGDRVLPLDCGHGSDVPDGGKACAAARTIV